MQNPSTPTAKVCKSCKGTGRRKPRTSSGKRIICYTCRGTGQSSGYTTKQQLPS